MMRPPPESVLRWTAWAEREGYAPAPPSAADPWWDAWLAWAETAWVGRSEDGWDHPDYQLEPDDELPF